ncbi:hypothetical protein ACQHGV_13490 [Sphingomonas pseudosanguinis]|uniref:hypothetical protein n=1 Tax=Sphingomonas pseudosanguinis TaxID=413712 RepID=UPI003F875263
MSLKITSDHAQLAFLGDAQTYKVTNKRGAISGVGVSVSGAGAWAKMTGSMTFEIMRLEDSKTYQEIRDSYKVEAGISAFWSWIGLHAGGTKEHEQITQTFHEIQQSQKVSGTVQIGLEVTGIYPNVQVDASAYILVLQVEDSQGNTFNVASSGLPASNTGAQSSDGTALPTKDNSSTITL